MTSITLWDWRLNEDRANCRAKQFGMNEENADPVSCQKKKKSPIAVLLSKLVSAAGVHSVSINHGLLTAEAARSRQRLVAE